MEDERAPDDERQPPVANTLLARHGITLELLPDRAVWCTQTSTLYVADLHWGKEAALRMHGVPVADQPLQADLERLTRLRRQTGSRRLVVLGDLLHGRVERPAALHAAIDAWRAQHHDWELLLIRGNHDRRAGDPPPRWGFRVENEDFREAGLRLRHFPPDTGASATPTETALDHGFGIRTEPDGNRTIPDSEVVLCGHLHPTLALVGPGGWRDVVPCFWGRGSALVLPAFSSLARGERISPAPDDELWLALPDRVVPWSTAGRAQVRPGLQGQRRR